LDPALTRRLSALLRDESGSELAEFALVLSLFSIVAIVAMQNIEKSANSTVGGNEGNFSGALVNAP